LLEKYLWQDAAKNVSGHTPVWKLHQHNPEKHLYEIYQQMSSNFIFIKNFHYQEHGKPVVARGPACL
jgi:hypothetical protein